MTALPHPLKPPDHRVTLYIAGTGEKVRFLPTPTHRANALRYMREPIERCTGWITWADLWRILSGFDQGPGIIEPKKHCLAYLEKHHS